MSEQLPDTQRHVYRWTALFTGSLLAIALIAVLRPFRSTEELRSPGPLYFDTPALNFSEEPCFAGDRIRNSTYLVNNSNADISLDGVFKSCTCVSATLQGEELAAGLVIPARDRRMIDIEVVTPRRAGPVAQALTIMYGNPPLYAQLDIFATVWIPLSARPHRISLRAHDQHSISSNGRVEGYVTLFDSSELPAPSVVGISTSHATLNAELVDDLDRTTNHNRHIASRHRVRISISEQELVDSREEFVFIEGIRTMPEGGQRTETLTIPVTLWAPNTVEAFPNSLTIFNEAPVDVVTRTIFFQGAETEPELVSTIPGVNVDVSNTVKTHGVECQLTLHTKGNNASGSLRFQIDRANIEIPLSIRTFATRH